MRKTCAATGLPLNNQALSAFKNRRNLLAAKFIAYDGHGVLCAFCYRFFDVAGVWTFKDSFF